MCCACVVCVVFITPLIFSSLQEVSGQEEEFQTKTHC